MIDLINYKVELYDINQKHIVIIAIDNMAVLHWILGIGDIEDINVYTGIKRIYENMSYVLFYTY